MYAISQWRCGIFFLDWRGLAWIIWDGILSMSYCALDAAAVNSSIWHDPLGIIPRFFLKLLPLKFFVVHFRVSHTIKLKKKGGPGGHNNIFLHHGETTVIKQWRITHSIASQTHFRDTVSVYLPNKGTFSPIKNQTHAQSDNTHT